MNASEWSYAGLPSLLDYLKGQATERKLRLFAAACARRFWSGSGGCAWHVPRVEVRRA